MTLQLRFLASFGRPQALCPGKQRPVNVELGVQRLKMLRLDAERKGPYHPVEQEGK